MNIPSLQNVRNFLMATLSFLIISVGAVYMYSAYIEKPYVTYTPLPFPMPQKYVYPGGVATATATRCNTRSTEVSYKSTRQFKRENSNEPAIILEPVQITIQPGCSSVSTRVNIVPLTATPGFYRFSGNAVIKGFMVDHAVPWNTDVFEVIAKPVPVATSSADAPAAPLLLPITNAIVKIEVKP